MRCVMLARAVATRWPASRALFLLHRGARYAHDVPFPAQLLDTSATHDTPAVRDAIGTFRPDVVIFDNAGRAEQLRAAKAAGALTIFISSRPNARRKGLTLRRIRWIDQHWIAQPEWATDAPTWWERIKKRAMTGLSTRYLDAIYEEGTPARLAALRTGLGIGSGAYLVFCPGGGGQFGHGLQVSAQFVTAAGQVHAASRLPCVMVGGPNATDSGAAYPAGVVRVGSLANADLMSLIAGADVVVSGGGDLLLQSLAAHKACVGIAIAGDQPARLRRCVARGLIRAAPAQADAIAREALVLAQSAAARAVLIERVVALGVRNALPAALDAICATDPGRR